MMNFGSCTVYFTNYHGKYFEIIFMVIILLSKFKLINFVGVDMGWWDDFKLTICSSNALNILLFPKIFDYDL